MPSAAPAGQAVASWAPLEPTLREIPRTRSRLPQSRRRGHASRRGHRRHNCRRCRQRHHHSCSGTERLSPCPLTRHWHVRMTRRLVNDGACRRMSVGVSDRMCAHVCIVLRRRGPHPPLPPAQSEARPPPSPLAQSEVPPSVGLDMNKHVRTIVCVCAFPSSCRVSLYPADTT